MAAAKAEMLGVGCSAASAAAAHSQDPRLARQSDKHVGCQELLPSGGIAGLEDGEAVVEGGDEGGYLGSNQLPLSAACD